MSQGTSPFGRVKSGTGSVISKLFSVLAYLKYVSPFWYLNKGIDRVLEAVVGKGRSDLAEASLAFYLVYRGVRYTAIIIYRDGVAGLFSVSTAYHMGSILLVGSLLWRYRRVKEAREEAKAYNEFAENYEDTLGLQSTPISLREVPKRRRAITGLLDTKVGEVVSRAWNVVNPARTWVYQRLLTVALLLDIVLTVIERELSPEKVTPDKTPRPLRERWDMEEPDEVDYPLLDRRLGGIVGAWIEGQSRSSSETAPSSA